MLAVLVVLGALSVWQSRTSTGGSTVAPVTTNPISRPGINGSQRPPLERAHAGSLDKTCGKPRPENAASSRRAAAGTERSPRMKRRPFAPRRWRESALETSSAISLA